MEVRTAEQFAGPPVHVVSNGTGLGCIGAQDETPLESHNFGNLIMIRYVLYCSANILWL